jgi:hypothetical protein
MITYAPHKSSPRKKHLLRDSWIVATFLMFPLVSGCGTFDTADATARPWNRATREEVEDAQREPGYWVQRPLPEQLRRRPDDHYP